MPITNEPTEQFLTAQETVLPDNNEKAGLYERLTAAAEEFSQQLREAFQSIEDSTTKALQEYPTDKDYKRSIEQIAAESIRQLGETSYEAMGAYLDTFEPEEIINPKNIHNLTDYINQEVEGIADRTGGCFVFFGEMHHETGVLAYQPELVRHMAKNGPGLKTIFLEEDEKMQPYVDQFMKTGVLPKELEHYLRHGFVRQETAVTHDHKIEILRAARESGTQVVFIDNNDHPNRDKDWYEKIKGEMGGKIEGVHIMFCGRNHATRKKSLETTNYNIGYSPAPSVGELISKTYPAQTLHIMGEGIHPNIPDGHEFQTMVGRLAARTLRRMDEKLTTCKTAVPLHQTVLGELPVFARLGRPDKSRDEFDMVAVVPSIPAFVWRRM